MTTTAFLKIWHEAVANKDLDLMASVVAEDATIQSPAYWTPKGPKPYVMMLLGAVTEAFEDFTYDKEWIDGQDLLLEFTAHVGQTELRGIDRITLNNDNKLQTLEVMIRPFNALVTMAEHVTNYFEKHGKQFAD